MRYETLLVEFVYLCVAVFVGNSSTHMNLKQMSFSMLLVRLPILSDISHQLSTSRSLHPRPRLQVQADSRPKKDGTTPGQAISSYSALSKTCPPPLTPLPQSKQSSKSSVTHHSKGSETDSRKTRGAKVVLYCTNGLVCNLKL